MKNQTKGNDPIYYQEATKLAVLHQKCQFFALCIKNFEHRRFNLLKLFPKVQINFFAMSYTLKIFLLRLKSIVNQVYTQKQEFFILKPKFLNHSW